MRHVKWILLAPVVVLLLVGCGYNTAGTGNEFSLRATVDHTGNHSVNVRIDEVVDSHGRAVNWFADGKNHQIHDNYNACDFHGRHTVGHVFSAAGNIVSLDTLSLGDRVEIVGKIRRNAAQCGKSERWKWRPVYDFLRELDR